MTTGSCVLCPNLDLRKACLLSGITTLLCNLTEMCFVAYKLVTLGEINTETEKPSSGSKRGETLASIFLLLLIAAVLSSLSVVKGAAHKSRKSMIPWLVFIAPVGVYGSVLVTLDYVVHGTTTENIVELVVWIAFIAVDVICFRGVVRYYRHLANESHSQTERRHLSAVFTISGGESGGRVGIVEVTLFPPAYEDVIVEGAPKYTVTSDGRVVPIDTKPPDYIP
ncbi:hypothetical protein NP493_122g07069 [Ridgeia piscesae]|uniref:Uncharacterized protein n=1 Tax=Ridgeia piscesae TaxID=27915 RepID=A0AAD9UGT9_RIDPI|nr:hypothetical protein NP493_122g07069 [Ridgeia piscesae]